jgi:RNA chaperone Hfq
MSYNPYNTSNYINPPSSYKPYPKGPAQKTSQAPRKPQPKKKEPVKITQTSLVQDMFLDSMKTQEKTILVQMNSGEKHSGVVNHFDRYIIILGPNETPTLLYKSGIESIKLV